MSTPTEITQDRESLRTMGLAGLVELYDVVMQDWNFGDPVTMPTLRTHTFAEASIEVGTIAKDLPVEGGGVLSNNRKRKAKAFLMIKRINDNDDHGFLWCDADGKPVRRSWIKKKRGLAMSIVKEELVEDYNNHEISFVDEYNAAIWLAHARTKVNAYVERARAGVSDGSRITFEGDRFKKKEYVFCFEEDPEINGTQ
ncbi:hypothetical protein FPOAC2_07738 [Fusarium poae]|uniref:hypothetical protein n=1 Tax=Fusarium poae TaxID=36050 RepID=UPI001CE94A1D|nr:hypothetical protein FPOAC1_007833 [Fusarium poae]KAG8668454.1 hypothetical protein FPOAC1_007833 [Fusarium poae]